MSVKFVVALMCTRLSQFAFHVLCLNNIDVSRRQGKRDDDKLKCV